MVLFVESCKGILRRFIPKPLLSAYHCTLAHLAALWYGRPSERLTVIGVTGTKGKSTTANLVSQLLELSGRRVGLTSTATMKVGEREWLNDMKMTMPGRFRLQRLLRDMVEAGCEYAVIETSSEGLAQFRHVGLHYDTVVLTNLSPEHLEAHGSYEAYRAAKGQLFLHLKRSAPKRLQGQVVPKRVVLNQDDGEYKFFSDLAAGEEWRFGSFDVDDVTGERDLLADVTASDRRGVTMLCRGRAVTTPLLGRFNGLNTLAAMATLLAHGASFADLAAAVPRLRPVPGRVEFIDEGQPFTVIVDYAHEPTSMGELYGLVAELPHRQVIHVFGPTGGGRDRWRRPVLGELAARRADVVVVTTDDPYDDDPAAAADEVLAGARSATADHPATLCKVVDRREAIREALRRAGPGDLVLITGKGAEQKMAVAYGQYLPWDDRQVVREELQALRGKL